MRKRVSFDSRCVVRDHQHQGRPALFGGATQVGNFDERYWGISASAVTWVSQSRHVDGEIIICRGRRLLCWKRRWQSYSLSEAQELPIAGKRLDVARAQPREVLVPLRQG